MCHFHIESSFPPSIRVLLLWVLLYMCGVVSVGSHRLHIRRRCLNLCWRRIQRIPDVFCLFGISGPQFRSLTAILPFISHPPRLTPTPRFSSSFTLYPQISSSADRLSLALRSLAHQLRVHLQNALREKISSGKGDFSNDRKSEIRSELDEIRNQQSDSKLNRGKVIEQLKTLQEGIQKKVCHNRLVRLASSSWVRVADQGPQCFQGQGQVQVC